MTHLFIDQYSGGRSLIHDLDPRTKITIFVLFVVFIVITPPLEFGRFALYSLLIGSLVAVSGLPVIFILKRLLTIAPFVIGISLFIPFLESADPAVVFWNICVKSSLSALCLILLSSTTPFPYLLKGLEKFRAPKIVIMVLSFVYRYLFISIDELMRMKQAKDSRTIRPGRLLEFKALSSLVGSLFIRSYERGERVYLAMCARGFNGDIKTINGLVFGRRDAAFFIIIVTLLITIKLLEV